MAMFSSNEDKILVKLIHKNPSIYDATLDSYKDKAVRKNIWKGIGKTLNKTSDECKKRWKYIRDSYNRCKRKNKLPAGPSASSKTSTWMLFERLHFLDAVPPEQKYITTIQDDFECEENREEVYAEAWNTNGWKMSGEESSEEGTSNEGASEAGISIAGTSRLKTTREETSEEGTSNKGVSESRIGKGGISGVQKKRKLQPKNILHTSALQYWKERDQQNQEQIKILMAQQLDSDIDGINSFCSHVGSILKKLTPSLRVEAKTKVFNLLAEYELKNVQHNVELPSLFFSTLKGEAIHGTTFGGQKNRLQAFPKMSPRATLQEHHHEIVFDNLKDNSVLPYSLIIIKGHVENLRDTVTQRSYLDVQSDKSQTFQVELKLGIFKFLTALKLGKNTIIISCCCSSATVSLEFKPRDTNLTVLPLYIICTGHDGCFQAHPLEPHDPQSACKRITVGCKLIQSLFAEKLEEAGFGRKTFTLDALGCVTFQSKLHYEEVYKMGQEELWYYFAREIMNSGLGSNNRKYLAFLSCTKYDGSTYCDDLNSHEELLKLTKGYVAFGGSGLALIGTACLYTWPENCENITRSFLDDTEVDRTRFLDDSYYRGTLSGCFSTNLGAAVHELCHTFDLGHTETGIMGRGFDNIQNVFLHTQSGNNSTPKSRLNYAKSCDFKPNDNTYWTKSCLVILNYHRWFNDFSSKEQTTLWYDQYSKIIKSSLGIRAIEIRRKSDEMLLADWIFLAKVLKHSFQISFTPSDSQPLIIFVEDNKGNVLKDSY